MCMAQSSQSDRTSTQTRGVCACSTSLPALICLLQQTSCRPTTAAAASVYKSAETSLLKQTYMQAQRPRKAAQCMYAGCVGMLSLTCSCSQACTSLEAPAPDSYSEGKLSPHAASSTGSTCCTTSLTDALISSPALALYCCRVGARHSERYNPTANGSSFSCSCSSTAGLRAAAGSGRHQVLAPDW